MLNYLAFLLVGLYFLEDFFMSNIKSTYKTFNLKL